MPSTLAKAAETKTGCSTERQSAAMRLARKRRQVAISAGKGLFCGGTQRTALVIMVPASLSPSAALAA